MISNITVPLVGMVDLALLGHLNVDNSEEYIGAIALGGMIFNIIYWGFGFLRMGTSGFTAQAFGKNNKPEMILIFSRALIVALAGSILIIALQQPIAWISFFIMDGSQSVEILAREYFCIRIYAAPATISMYAFYGWFLGMQNAKYPMIIAIVINLLNTVFSFLLIYAFGMKHDGVALGTVLAQYCGLILSIILFSKKYKSLVQYWTYKAMVRISALKDFFLVNKDIVIRTLLLIFTFSFFTNQSAAISDEILAVNSILLQYLFIFSYFIDGFANAAEALVGKYVGAKNKPGLFKSVKSLFIWGLGISIPFTLLYIAAGDKLLFILTDNTAVIEKAMPYLFWIAMIPIISFPAFIWDGVFIGATATAPMRNTLIVATLLIFLPVYYLLIGPLGDHGLWLAMIVFMFVRGLFLTLYAPAKILNKI